MPAKSVIHCNYVTRHRAFDTHNSSKYPPIDIEWRIRASEILQNSIVSMSIVNVTNIGTRMLYISLFSHLRNIWANKSDICISGDIDEIVSFGAKIIIHHSREIIFSLICRYTRGFPPGTPRSADKSISHAAGSVLRRYIDCELVARILS